MKTLAALFWSFLKIGTVGYGGGPSMVPLIKEEVVNLQGWMTQMDFTDLLAVANALPGPVATKLSVAVGIDVAGLPGALAATIAVVLPSALALIILLKFVAKVRDNPGIKSTLTGLRPVVVAMLAYAAYDMSDGSLIGLRTWLIGLAAFAAMVFTKIHPALLIIAGACAGVILAL